MRGGRKASGEGIKGGRGGGSERGPEKRDKSDIREATRGVRGGDKKERETETKE